MRPTLLEADDAATFQPPPPPPCHDIHGCARHSNNGGAFEANAAAVLILLLCALICALILNAAVRCFLRRPADHDPPELAEVQDESTKPTTLVEKLRMAPALVFTAEMKPKLAGAEAECAICLTEFAEGEEISVLAICKHGFHVQCIQSWLILHSSCPTCRCSYLLPSAERGGDGGGEP